MFGEVFDANPAFIVAVHDRGRLQSTLDFAFQCSARAASPRGSRPTACATLFADDDYYTDADSNAYALPTFLGNHDMGRIGQFLAQANSGATDAELLARDSWRTR